MRPYQMKFSHPDPTGPVRITPLGAAVVEALPDRRIVAKINRDFRRLKVCPMSALFDEAGINAFYHGTIIPLPQHLY